MAKGDYVQASEKFWGATAEMVKTVAVGEPAAGSPPMSAQKLAEGKSAKPSLTLHFL